MYLSRQHFRQKQTKPCLCKCQTGFGFESNFFNFRVFIFCLNEAPNCRFIYRRSYSESLCNLSTSGIHYCIFLRLVSVQLVRSYQSSQPTGYRKYFKLNLHGLCKHSFGMVLWYLNLNGLAWFVDWIWSLCTMSWIYLLLPIIHKNRLGTPGFKSILV